MGVILTAGYDRAAHVSLLAQALLEDGVAIAGILVVRPFSFRRARALVRQRGRGALVEAARKAVGRRGQASGRQGPVEQLSKEWGLTPGSLRELARDKGIPYRAVPSLGARKALEFVADRASDGVIYGGGGIVGDAFIQAVNGRVLNAHSGPLPQIRGMNALEWSCLLGLPPTVTIHFIDRGIDTGPVVTERSIAVEPGDDVGRLRDKCVAEGVRGLRQAIGALAAPLPPALPDRAAHRQCFVVAPALREILDRGCAP